MKTTDPMASKMKRAFGMDMIEVKNKGNGDIGFGLNYDVQGGHVQFSGVPDRGVVNRNMTIVMKNEAEKVLKELRVEGNSNNAP